MNDLRNWLERLGDKIPGYSGYAARERRRDADKLQREHLAERIRAGKQKLSAFIRELTSTGRLMEVGPYDRVMKKLDQLENRVRFATYGYTGFFDAVKIDEPRLEALYRFDLQMLEAWEEVERMLGEYQDNASGEAKLSSTELERAVDRLNATFDERYRAINDYDRGSAPGRPLF